MAQTFTGNIDVLNALGRAVLTIDPSPDVAPPAPPTGTTPGRTPEAPSVVKLVLKGPKAKGTRKFGDSIVLDSGDKSIQFCGDSEGNDVFIKNSGDGKVEMRGSGDPLLAINHTGNTGNPAIWLQQDGAARAYLWWDRNENRLNLGTPTTNPIMSLLNNGNVGIGTTNPNEKLHVAGKDVVRCRVSSNTNSGVRLCINEQAQWSVATVLASEEFPRGDFQIFNDRLGKNAIYIDGLSLRVGIGMTQPGFALDVAGEAHASDFLVSSDERLKTEVKKLNDVLEKVEQMRGVSFKWNRSYEASPRAMREREIGVIAQEVEAVFPELVATAADDGYKSVDYGKLSAVLLEAIKELRSEAQAELKALADKHFDLQRQLVTQQKISETLSAKVAALELTQRST